MEFFRFYFHTFFSYSLQNWFYFEQFVIGIMLSLDQQNEYNVSVGHNYFLALHLQ